MIKSESRVIPTTHKVCSDCGITHTPLWRGGPNGPKTMCNACGIRWKRAHQNGHKAKHNEKFSMRLEDLSEDDFEQRSGDDSAEDALISDTEVSSGPGHEAKDSISAPLPHKKSIRKKLFKTNTKAKPYSRSTQDQDLEKQIQAAMLLLQQAAEEFDQFDDMSDDSADSSSLNASIGGSPTRSPLPMVEPNFEPARDKMDLLFNEVMALRQEVQKRDAIIDMYRAGSQPSSPISSSPVKPSFLFGKNFNGLPPFQPLAM